MSGTEATIPEINIEGQAAPSQIQEPAAVAPVVEALAVPVPAEAPAAQVPETAAPVAVAPVTVPAGGTTEHLVAMVDTYKREFEEVANSFRQRSVRIQEDGSNFVANAAASVEPIKQDIISTITDTTDVATPAMAIVNIFGWASILLFGASVGSILGAYLLAPFIGIFVGKAGAALAAAVGIPAYGYYLVKKADTENSSDSETRFILLGLALVQGLLTGFVLSETYVSAQPLAFLFTAAVALSYPFIQKSLGAKRISLLAASIGAAVAVNFVFGFVSGNLTGACFLLTVLYAVAAAGVSQFVFRNVSTAEQRVHLYQLALLGSFITAKLVVFGLCGGAKEAVQIQAKN